MARKRRVISETGAYHVILRGVNKQTVFENDDDKEYFLSKLFQYKKKCNFLLLGYVIMDNHVHLIILTMNMSISDVFRRVATSYARYFNDKYGRCGPVFQGRFFSDPITSLRKLLSCLWYVLRNPVKAGICKSAIDFAFSSFGDYSNCVQEERADLCSIDKKPNITDIGFLSGILNIRSLLKGVLSDVPETIEIECIANNSVFKEYYKKFLDYNLKALCYIKSKYENGKHRKNELVDKFAEILEGHCQKYVTDSEGRKFLKNEFGIECCADFPKRVNAGRDIILVKLIEHGLRCKQISRLTGVCWGTIMKARLTYNVELIRTSARDIVWEF